MSLSSTLTLLLPPWHLSSKVKSAGDNEVEATSDICVEAEWAFAGLVILGVIAEFIIAAKNPPHDSWLGHWGGCPC
jgi:hypothetical protein